MNNNNMKSDDMNTFWKNQLDDIINISPEELKTHQLPISRIKKIMKEDEKIKNSQMISADTPVLLAKACELFIMEFTRYAWQYTEENKRRTLQRQDVIAAACRKDIFDFLIDLISIEDRIKYTNLNCKENSKKNSNKINFDMMKQYYNINSSHLDEDNQNINSLNVSNIANSNNSYMIDYSNNTSLFSKSTTNLSSIYNINDQDNIINNSLLGDANNFGVNINPYIHNNENISNRIIKRNTNQIGTPNALINTKKNATRSSSLYEENISPAIRTDSRVKNRNTKNISNYNNNINIHNLDDISKYYINNDQINNNNFSMNEANTNNNEIVDYSHFNMYEVNNKENYYNDEYVKNVLKDSNDGIVNNPNNPQSDIFENGLSGRPMSIANLSAANDFTPNRYNNNTTNSIYPINMACNNSLENDSHNSNLNLNMHTTQASYNGINNNMLKKNNPNFLSNYKHVQDMHINEMLPNLQNYQNNKNDEENIDHHIKSQHGYNAYNNYHNNNSSSKSNNNLINVSNGNQIGYMVNNKNTMNAKTMSMHDTTMYHSFYGMNNNMNNADFPNMLVKNMPQKDLKNNISINRVPKKNNNSKNNNIAKYNNSIHQNHIVKHNSMVLNDFNNTINNTISDNYNNELTNLNSMQNKTNSELNKDMLNNYYKLNNNTNTQNNSGSVTKNSNIDNTNNIGNRNVNNAHISGNTRNTISHNNHNNHYYSHRNQITDSNNHNINNTISKENRTNEDMLNEIHLNDGIIGNNRLNGNRLNSSILNNNAVSTKQMINNKMMTTQIPSSQLINNHINNNPNTPNNNIRRSLSNKVNTQYENKYNNNSSQVNLTHTKHMNNSINNKFNSLIGDSGLNNIDENILNDIINNPETGIPKNPSINLINQNIDNNNSNNNNDVMHTHLNNINMPNIQPLIQSNIKLNIDPNAHINPNFQLLSYQQAPQYSINDNAYICNFNQK
ncbi:oocyst rupture protein 2, putative [Plasmodium chabaudi chabaudi]|uniref:Oocyst rupture protein 2, putative n=1 Tax=Plasmodium chabaudi chabaudi TaxID=31271 RepID=A0A4V0KCE5_PLACU|nr:oocyst rupture protein 2, putative [Plasmodium chabaudi chabaudi]VTZ70016.1 oocyst rupture protein 2, putative [Plasmodium chabaudi chabaudi]|eukprot:XP_740051.2 CCAAT-binding transcription factor, putative [Plasmodium chabaudi chabaudi]